MSKRTSKKECARRKVEIYKIWQRLAAPAGSVVGKEKQKQATPIQKVYYKEAGIEVPRTTIGGWIREFEEGWEILEKEPGAPDPLVPFSKGKRVKPPVSPSFTATADHIADAIIARLGKLEGENLQLKKQLANRELVMDDMTKRINEDYALITKMKTEQNWWAKLKRGIGL